MAPIVGRWGFARPMRHANRLKGMHMPDRWVTFDCYGTLVDWLTGMRTALKSVGIEGDDCEELLAVYQVQEMVVKARGWCTYPEVLEVGLGQASTLTGVELSSDQAKTVAQAWGDWPVFPDVLEGMATLREQGWKPVILTDGDDDFFAATAQKLTFDFDKVMTSNKVQGFKPDLAPFRRFQEEIGAEATWVHAANSWIHDIMPTTRMEVRSVWVDRDRTTHPATMADRWIHDIASLPDALADLEADPRPAAKR